jgi:glucose-6-phosphate isomerase
MVMAEALSKLWGELEVSNFRHFQSSLRCRIGCLLTLGILSFPGGLIRFDWAKTHLFADAERVLVRIAAAQNLVEKRRQLFERDGQQHRRPRCRTYGPAGRRLSGKRGRGRGPSRTDAGIGPGRSTKVCSAKWKSLIHIGIGGSALGPALAIDALAREGAKVAVHVVSNIDGCALEAAFKVAIRRPR